MDEDSVLLARLRQGERSAFAELNRRYGSRLLRLAHRLLGYRDEAAQDAVQDVFARLLSRPVAIAASGDLEKWLVTVVVNQCRTHHRRWFARLRLLGRAPAKTQTSAPADVETHEFVRHAVRQLPPRDREVIVLHYLEEMPVEQIGVILKLKRNAVEVRLHRARQRLKEILTA
ncbi:MAG TPA: sigma-70 family RNA polymerase sigma factor [Tepidisphaeraceae bacterium]|nr:sigma-70 family RNA polymerase sigma factor [Tepidisphaeraceae bacterium]